ncbi:MAG TPA: cell division protein FtsZ, partial [Anaerolineaceae bacterium]|nr:cell division protein FtsZ [Anaerolineaceae bacterium]
IKETAHPDVNLIFGAVIDPNMGDECRITVIATGFDQAGMRSRLRHFSDLNEKKTDENRFSARPVKDNPESIRTQYDFQPRVYNTEDIEKIPAFIRNREND